MKVDTRQSPRKGSMFRGSRREVLGLGMAAATGMVLARSSPAQQSPPGPQPRPGVPALHRYENYGWLRGFSVIPSWGARIEQAWWDYHPDRFREEIALARTVHANCIRLWIEFTAWMADPDKIEKSFFDAVAAIASGGMKVMPCLFNRWHDARWDYGGTYTEDLMRGDWGPKLEYVRRLVKPLARDPRVLVWDLCNEPQAFNTSDPVSAKEYQWLSAVAAAARESGAQQPITIGTMIGENIATYAPLCDVLCAHPYCWTRAELAKLIASFKALRERFHRPMLVNECIPGCLDDRRRGALAQFYVEDLSAAGLGWMGWSLREGRAISTRRDRYDGNGLDGQGFHAWFTKEGRLRAGLEFLLEPPKIKPPWL
jgi:hypothetical protein